MLSCFPNLVIFSIPSGFIASRIGRKRTILVGITMLFLVFVTMNFAINMNPIVIYVLLAIGGISWALININSYPMVVEMTSNKGIGKYTGYYYFFSMTSAILSPILYGFIKDLLGDSVLFIYSSIAMVLAFFFMMLVKHGEPKVKQEAALQE